jgi:hypothetical protein
VELDASESAELRGLHYGREVFIYEYADGFDTLRDQRSD